MKTQLVRFAYRHRSFLKRFIFIRRPVLIRLPEFKLYVRLDDWAVGARIAVKRSYEPHVTRALGAALKHGAVLLDIGANIGYYTLFAAARTGPAGKVIAFEPSSDNCALLRMSLQANRFEHVRLYPYAVADREGIVGFGMDDSNGRISQANPSASQFQVQAVALDTFLKDEPRVDVIKMDIEGAESLALHGMRGLIRRHRPLLFTEFSPHGLELASASTPQGYLDQLRDLGYELFVIPRNGEIARTPQSNQQIMGHFARPGQADHLDLIGTPRHGAT